MFETFLAAFAANVVAFGFVAVVAIMVIERKIKEAQTEVKREVEEASAMMQAMQSAMTTHQIADDFPAPKGGSN